MAKKSTKGKGQKKTPSNRAAGAGRRAAARSGAGSARTRKTGRKTAGARTPRGKAARKQARNAPRPGKKKKAPARASKTRAAASRARTQGRKGAARPKAKAKAKRPAAPKAGAARRAGASPRRGGTGRERELAQTPETGRTVRGRTNPMPAKRSTGTAAGAGSTRRAPGLERDRRQLRELEENIPTPPSSLDLDRLPSAARTGRAEMREAREDHTESSPVLTGGDVDADWQDAYAVGDEAPGGDNPTPDQDRVEDIGKALGVTYEDNEELKASDKITERDRHRWELDPASSEDYRDRDKDVDEE